MKKKKPGKLSNPGRLKLLLEAKEKLIEGLIEKTKGLERAIEGWRKALDVNRESVQRDVDRLNQKHQREIENLKLRIEALLFSQVLFHDHAKQQAAMISRLQDFAKQGDSVSLAVGEVDVMSPGDAFEDLAKKRDAYFEAKHWAHGMNYRMNKQGLASSINPTTGGIR